MMRAKKWPVFLGAGNKGLSGTAAYEFLLALSCSFLRRHPRYSRDFEPEDLAHDAWIELWHELGGSLFPKRRWEAVAHKMFRRLVDRAGDRGRRVPIANLPVEPAAKDPAPPKMLESKELNSRFARAIVRLSSSKRRLFRRFVNGTSIKELAARDGHSPSTLYKQIENIMLDLGARLQDRPEGVKP